MGTSALVTCCRIMMFFSVICTQLSRFWPDWLTAIIRWLVNGEVILQFKEGPQLGVSLDRVALSDSVVHPSTLRKILNECIAELISSGTSLLLSKPPRRSGARGQIWGTVSSSRGTE